MNMKEISEIKTKKTSDNILGISPAEFNKLTPAEQRIYLKQRFHNATNKKEAVDKTLT